MRIFYSILLCTFLLNGCQKQGDLELYDINKAYIEFGIPTVWGKEQNLYMDSTFFSFAMQSSEKDTVVFAVPIQIIGQQKDEDREYKVSVNMLQENNLRFLEISKPIIHSGRFVDTLLLKVKKVAAMRDNIFTVALDLEENQFFELGKPGRTKCQLQITDQFFKPSWWTTWGGVFGPYYQEVYQQWIKIYLPGLDKTPPAFSVDKPGFAWNNMPTYPLKNVFPVTFMYIDQLKQYFEKNEVYPDGDKNRPRIYLP
jgi:hypothetical protein